MRCVGSLRRFDLIHLILNEVMRSLPLQQLAFKIVLDIGCMRSVAGVKWANQVLQRWRDKGRWYQVQKECDAFKFGDGQVLHSKFRILMVGSFAGKPVVDSFSVVEGHCPPLFSRSGCTQVGPSLTVSIMLCRRVSSECAISVRDGRVATTR